MPIASLDRFADEIREADYRRATSSFCRIVAAGDQPMRDVVGKAIAAAAPMVQLPSHLMQQPSGDMRGVNYDHTILGWRAALRLVPGMADRRASLPPVQAMWYLPQGLHIWEQVICEFPGHYAIAQGCNRRFPGPEPDANRFDGPAWTTPGTHFEDRPPIVLGSAEDRLDQLGWAILEGDREASYRLFVGLAADREQRPALKERVLFAGIIDLQDTIYNRGGYQNLGHKALRARALIDLADYLGWDGAHDVFYSVVPDLATSPRLHGLWNEIGNVVTAELADGRGVARRALPASERQLDRLTDALLWGGPTEVNDAVTDLYQAGCGILDVADSVVVGYQRYVIDVIEHPNAFASPTHAFDYCNVVNSWLREFQNPHQVKGPYMAARFVNDAIRANAMLLVDPDCRLESRHTFRAWADGIAGNRLLGELHERVIAQDAPRACALTDSYLERTTERELLISTVVEAACRFQNDPHIMRNCTSSVEEFRHNQTGRRDDILRGFVKHQARYVKRSRSHDAYDLHRRYFDPFAS